MLKRTIHSSNTWAKSLENGSLMIVLQSRFSPNMPVGPVIFKLVSYRSIIFGSIVILLGSIIIIFGQSSSFQGQSSSYSGQSSSYSGQSSSY